MRAQGFLHNGMRDGQLGDGVDPEASNETAMVPTGSERRPELPVDSEVQILRRFQQRSPLWYGERILRRCRDRV